jgi:hypothetical protein
MQMERIWAMPNKWTFTIGPIRLLIQDEVDIENEQWADPFAGMNSVAQIRNDLNPDMEAEFHMDALEFLKTRKDEEFDGVFFDPPYSITQARRCYDGFGMDKLEIKPTSMKYWAECKNEISRITKSGGKCICFGWSSMGLGKNRGWNMERVLLVPHGGSKNDTIVTVEVKHKDNKGKRTESKLQEN